MTVNVAAAVLEEVAELVVDALVFVGYFCRNGGAIALIVSNSNSIISYVINRNCF